VARIGKLMSEGNAVKTHGGISTNKAEGMRLNMNDHKNNWGGAKIICR
jgi:hypothetical protein